MARLPYLFPCLLLAACKFGDDNRLGTTVDAGVDGPAPATGHLLITEIASDGAANEFVEIWNPSNQDINLGKYYLSDFVDYWKFPTRTLTTVSSDFIIGFPDTVLASNQVIVVALSAAGFAARYSRPADYAVDSDIGASNPVRYRLASNVGGQLPSITDGGEYVALFYWDGDSDTLKDVDLILAGTTTSAANMLKNKEAVDGPDPDTVATAYKADMGNLGGGMTANATTGTSYKRKLLESGSERQNGDGNGITGDDETTESLKATWDGASAVPTPGVIPTF